MRTHRTKSNLHTQPASGACRRVAVRASERGVALVITLLLLSMIVALSVGMVIAMSSQTLIGGYYRNFRSSFYAADSGLNIASQTLVNQLQAGVPAGAFTNPPIANTATLAANVLSTTNGSYGSTTSLNAGNAGQSWAESFKITNSTLTPVLGFPQITSSDTTTVGCTAVAPCPTGYTYKYNYSLTSVGSSTGSESQSVTETGLITLNVTGLAKAYGVNFSYFGAFVDVYNGGTGPLVPGTMTGPMFTNGSWEFMPTTSQYPSPYIFTDPVGQQLGVVDYWNSCICSYNASTASSYGSGSQLVAPTFQEGLFLNQPKVNLPSNSLNQEEAVVDGLGNNNAWTASGVGGLATLTNVTNSSTAWSSSATKGVFTNQGTTAAACGTKTPPCVLGGGFYVEGAADVELLPVSGSDTAQQYIIKQTIGGNTTTTITVDPAANGGAGTTVIQQGSTVYPTLNGVPMNGLVSSAQTEVYVDGGVTIHGPAQGQAAVQDNAMIGVTANGDITATADILYKTEPVTIPQDTLVPATSTNPMNQVLGLFTANGNFNTNTSQTNIEVDASIATVSSSESANCSAGKGGQVSSSVINTFNNVGGMIQSCIFPAPITTENTWYDRRFKNRPGFAPPWFPSTTVTQGGALPVNTVPTIQRLQWLNTSAQ
jgi:Tfp pilus assembly protein PilX